MVLSGGCFRFGMHLGMYAAACDAGRVPDLVLASCGGALAAAVIHTLPDLAEQKAWLESPEMHRFWGAIQPAPAATILRTLLGVASRAIHQSPAPRVPDLFGNYLFALPALPQLARHGATRGPEVALIGSKPAEVCQPRGRRKLFEQVVFCGPRAAALLHGTAAPLGGTEWGNSAVAPVVTDTTLPLDVAARISVSDMYYFNCHSHGGAH